MAKDTGTAPAPRPAEKVRNVALVGHAGAGKTTLAEALLVATGALPRAGRIEDGTTALDTEEVEVRQQRSVSLGVATIEHADHRITLLDTPGSPDFVGELRAGLRAADAALFVVSAVNGVDAATVQLWEECAAVVPPHAIGRPPVGLVTTDDLTGPLGFALVGGPDGDLVSDMSFHGSLLDERPAVV